MITNNPPRVWNSVDKVWLSLMSLSFGPQGQLTHVQAMPEGQTDPFKGFYTFEGKDLKKIAVTGQIDFNTDLAEQGLRFEEAKEKLAKADALVPENPRTIEVKGHKFTEGYEAMCWYYKIPGEPELDLFFCKLLKFNDQRGEYCTCQLYFGEEMDRTKIKGTITDVLVQDLVSKD